MTKTFQVAADTVRDGHVSVQARRLKVALCSTTALVAVAIILPSIAALGLVMATPASAQTTGGGGAPVSGNVPVAEGGAGGGYGQNGGNGDPGTTGGGGGGPGPAGTLGGLPGDNSGGFGGAGGANGVTAAAVPVLSAFGAAGGDAQPSVNGTTTAGAGGGAGGYGLVLTTAGPHATTAGQVFQGGNGGAANGSGGTNFGGLGGIGGGGVLLQAGGTFTNAQGASVLGGNGGASPTTGAYAFYHTGGNGLETSAGGTPATIINAGTITAGNGGTTYVAPGTPSSVDGGYGASGGIGILLLSGGSITNTATGVITGGSAEPAFAGSPTHRPSRGGLDGGEAIRNLEGGSITNDGQIVGGAGAGPGVSPAGSLPQVITGLGASRAFAAGRGGQGLNLFGTSVVNNATGVIRGGNGGSGGSGVVNPGSGNQPIAGQAGEGGRGVSMSGGLLNFGQIFGGNAGLNANATTAGQVGAGNGDGYFFGVGGDAVVMIGAAQNTVDNRGLIRGGRGADGGMSGAGAAGAAGGAGGVGLAAFAPFTDPLAIANTGTIAGGNGGAGSTGTTTGAHGAGGVGLTVAGDGTVRTSGTISGGLSGDGVTRANAITFLDGVHTLTLQTGATFNGNVVVDTAAAIDPGVSANNTLDLDSAGSGTVSLPQFQNFGLLTQTGAGGGTWTLTGAGAFTTSASVSAGTMVIASGATLTAPTTSVQFGGLLAVNGTLNGALSVNSGGTLGGTGTIGGNVTVNGGQLAPGNSIGVLTINGNLVLGAGSVYVVEVSPTNADRTNVSGTATLGGSVHAIFGAGSYTSNSHTILSAAGGRSGTFTGLTTSGLPATLSASLSYTSTDVLLVTLTSQIAGILVGNTPNQRAVAAAQDTAFNRGLPNMAALYGLSLAQVPAALDQLSGEVHVGTAGVLADESLYVRSAILGRLRQAGSNVPALGMGGPQAFTSDGTEAIDSALAYAKTPLVTKAPMRAPAPSHDLVFWAQGLGAWGRFETDGNAATVRRDLAGFFTGVDTRVGTHGRVGVAAGYTGSKNALDGRGTANVESGHVAAYGGWGFGAWNLRAGGAYAFHSIDTDRFAAFPGFADRLQARYDGGTGQIFGELGYGLSFGNLAIEPFAGAAWVHVKTDAAAERGGIAALNFAGTTFETGYSMLGIRAASMIALSESMMLVPRATLAWQHALGSTTPTGVLAFQNAAVPFTIAGVPIARDSLLAEAGLDLAIGRNATLGISYHGQIASNVSDHSAKGKFVWKF